MPVVLLALAALAALADPAPDDIRRDAIARYGVGVLRARDDRPVEAVRQFEAAAKADPAAAEPLRQLVGVYRDLGRDAAAIRTAESVLRIDPADAATAHTLGKLLYDAKRFPDAARALKQAADSPRLADRPAQRLGVLRDLARACDAAGDPAGVEAALRDALPLAPTPRDATAMQEKLGQALAAQKKFGPAEAAFAAAAESAGSTAAARLEWNRSAVAAGRGDPEAAVAHLMKYLALQPVSPEPYERLAELLREAGRPGDAVPTLARLAAKNWDVKAVQWVHAAEVGRTDPVRGNDMFRRLALTFTGPNYFPVLVRYYREANRPTELLLVLDSLYRAARPAAVNNPPPVDPAKVASAQAVTAAVRADREAGRMLLGNLTDFTAPLPADLRYSDDTWDLLAGLAERDGRLDLAEQAARQLWENRATPRMGGRRGNDDGGFRRLYELLVRQRKWEAALDLCEEAGTRRNVAVNYFRAIPLAELGRGREALDAADVAVPNLNDLFARRLHKARVLNVLDRHQEAAEVCRTLLREAGTATDARRTRYVLSEALLGLKDAAGAEAELRAVLDDDPDDVLALNNLGYNLADQGRKLDEAEAMIRRAMLIDRDERARAGDPDPESGVYRDSLGWVLFRRGKLIEARAALEAAVAQPDSAADAVVWDHLGDVAFRQGDAARARDAWTKAVGLYARSHHGRQAGRLVEAERKLRLVP